MSKRHQLRLKISKIKKKISDAKLKLVLLVGRAKFLTGEPLKDGFKSVKKLQLKLKRLKAKMGKMKKAAKSQSKYTPLMTTPEMFDKFRLQKLIVSEKIKAKSRAMRKRTSELLEISKKLKGHLKERVRRQVRLMKQSLKKTAAKLRKLKREINDTYEHYLKTHPAAVRARVKAKQLALRAGRPHVHRHPFGRRRTSAHRRRHHHRHHHHSQRRRRHRRHRGHLRLRSQSEQKPVKVGVKHVTSKAPKAISKAMKRAAATMKSLLVRLRHKAEQLHQETRRLAHRRKTLKFPYKRYAFASLDGISFHSK